MAGGVRHEPVLVANRAAALARRHERFAQQLGALSHDERDTRIAARDAAVAAVGLRIYRPGALAGALLRVVRVCEHGDVAYKLGVLAR